MSKPLTYNQAYNKGWKASMRAGDMGAAESRFISFWGEVMYNAWIDGWLDYAVGRDKYHLRDCPNHDACP